MNTTRLVRRRVLPTTALALLLLALSLTDGLAGVALAQAGGPYDLTWSTLDGGGGMFSTGGDYSLGGTVAQPDAGISLSGGTYTLVGGFWSGGTAPTAVTLAGFWIEVRGGALVARWETATEVDTVGFHLYRSDTGEPGSFVRLNEGVIPGQAPGSPVGASYEWIDVGVEAGQTYFYLLEDVDVDGQATQHGPVPAALPSRAPYRIYLPLVNG